jgi:hypothetical protein
MHEIDKFCLGLIKAIAKRLAGDEDSVNDYLPEKPPVRTLNNKGRSNSFTKSE